MGEFELISKIRRILEAGDKSPRVVVGIGDDCAVTKANKQLVLSTIDCMVEGIHFDLKYFEPAQLGARALAISLSDIAAMGGTPRFALVSLGLRPGITEKVVHELYRGMKRLAVGSGIQIVGGNITRTSREFFIDVAVWGESAKPKLRASAKVKDWIVLTGPTGLSACGLALLQRSGKAVKARYPKATAKHLSPTPRLEAGKILSRQLGVNAVIDISDGLSSELHHLAKASQVGFVIERERLPIAKELLKAGSVLKCDPMQWALHGGEDYELLATLRPQVMNSVMKEFKRKGLPLYPIGRVVEQRLGVSLCSSNGNRTPLKPMGWTHF